MTRPLVHRSDPRLDLVFERTVDVAPRLVWMAWTVPEHLKKWFTPAPWTTTDCEIDLRPGGIFRTVMRSPEGQDFPGLGCYLEVVRNERLVWTNALGPGYRPTVRPTDDSCEAFAMTAFITLEARADGTNYNARVIHGDAASRKKHQDMGFHDGWGKALDQLVALARTL
jgi:uncharacterized protein YndB with AHSA1/START domain